MFSWSFSQMNMGDYPNCSLGEDGNLRTMGRHRPGFPRELLSALVRLGYDGPIPVYRFRPFQAHGLNVCEVRVEIPFYPMVPWKGAIVGSEIDDADKKMAHVALTSLCESSLTATADMPITLFLIQNLDEPDWQQCHETVCDVTSPHFSAGSVEMAKYSRYLFNLQHNTGRTVIKQRACLNAYEEQVTFMSCEMEMLRYENAILRRRTLQSSDKDLELQVAYHHLSEAEHGLNNARQQLDLTREEVDTWTHAIMHLKNVIETQDVELDESTEMITNLEQQLLELQLQTPPAPEDPDEAGTMSGVDED
jgi:hypothetical protein